jgi:ABC-type multidrug transport system ATPase subunit/ABC-type multidrug transport system permease subunit
MGASGAGKSTFLDILARKAKRGVVSGTTRVNGREVGNAEFKEVVGFVDQEDTLMSTLTVYETVLYSALLRLPREMSIEAKKFRTLETMSELGILGIKDMRIGDSGRRSISGGEKRRVSIACELVTSPSILFLDEPTSGLDAFNAFNVVESLVNLARTHRRTVIFTIHQPRSNIVALFDQLILLASGKCVYSGEFAKCQGYFESIGQPCPPGFNIADYLIDMTMHATLDQSSGASNSSAIDVTSPDPDNHSAFDADERDVERAGHSLVPHSVPISVRSLHSANLDDDTDIPLTATTTVNHSNAESTSSTNYLKKKTSQIFDAVANGPVGTFMTSKKLGAEAPIPPALSNLVNAYRQSEIAAQIQHDGEELRREAERSDSGVATTGEANGNGPVNHALPDVALETSMLRGRKRATWGTQFRILSGRAFKNLYRDPALLTAHYTSAILLAVICGLFVHNVTNDIAGFQNRLGIFFFSLALFGFSCLSSLGLFANERILFMRERSNGYYSSFTYFASKILFDILPLRLVPPLMFGGIVYGLVGFVPAVATFWKFLLALVLFNLTTASVVLWLSIAFADVGVASLVGTLIMLFNLLFTGLLINRDSMSRAFQWLHTISFFHAAFEALAVNELRYLQLKEMKYGVELDVPAATILSTFGLRAQSYWWPNISLLGIFFVTFTTASYITLHYFVKEKR